jgi:hypothetical protein
MSKKLYAMLLPILAVAAFASMTGAAQAAEFHWYKCEKAAGAGTKFNNEGCTATGATNEFEFVRLPFTSAKTMVDTFGTLTLVGSNGLSVKCSVIDAGNIWNVTELTPGKDEITQFVNFNCTSNSEALCKKPTIEAKGLPWTTELGGGPIDTIKGIKVTLQCEGLEPITFEGELKPKLIPPTISDPLIAEFVTASGTLTGPAGSGLTATVTGQDRIVGFAHGENITVKAP